MSFTNSKVQLFGTTKVIGDWKMKEEAFTVHLTLALCISYVYQYISHVLTVPTQV